VVCNTFTTSRGERVAMKGNYGGGGQGKGKMQEHRWKA